ncbi:MAG: hypothetical protein H6526_08920 [Actinobacteria bacterium]|nr:hypothetical protein [Actinomycetota bacterium]
MRRWRKSQRGRCLLCDAPAAILVVDHRHDTGRARALPSELQHASRCRSG